MTDSAFHTSQKTKIRHWLIGTEVGTGLLKNEQGGTKEPCKELTWPLANLSHKQIER